MLRTSVKRLLPFVTAPGQSSVPPEFAPLYLSVYDPQIHKGVKDSLFYSLVKAYKAVGNYLHAHTAYATLQASTFIACSFIPPKNSIIRVQC